MICIKIVLTLRTSNLWINRQNEISCQLKSSIIFFDSLAKLFRLSINCLDLYES